MCELNKSDSSRMTSDSEESDINDTNPEISHENTDLTIQDNGYQQGYALMITFPVQELIADKKISMLLFIKKYL